MKITLASLLKRRSDAESEKNNLQDQKRKAEALAEELKIKAEEAAVSGDVEGYLRFKSEADRQEAVAHVADVRLHNTTNPVTQEDARAAWDTFCAENEPKFRANLAELDKARDSFFRAYNACADVQKEFCKTREELGALIGLVMGHLDAEPIASAFPLPAEIPVQGLLNGVTLNGPTGILDRDLAYIVSLMGNTAVEVSKSEEAKRLIRLVTRKKTK